MVRVLKEHDIPINGQDIVAEADSSGSQLMVLILNPCKESQLRSQGKGEAPSHKSSWQGH